MGDLLAQAWNGVRSPWDRLGIIVLVFFAVAYLGRWIWVRLTLPPLIADIAIAVGVVGMGVLLSILLMYTGWIPLVISVLVAACLILVPRLAGRANDRIS